MSASYGQTLPANQPTVVLTAVSGYAGHAFVYAQVNDSGTAYPAPTGTHESPYYSEWVREPIGGSSCPWLWAVYVFDRLTHTQVNLPRSGGSGRNFGTTTVICASPSSTPVDQPPVGEASAQLDLDLRVSVAPQVIVAGSTSVLSAALSSRLTQDLDLYLNMAIEDWRVTNWSLDFGDGQEARLMGRGATTIDVSHIYRSAGRYDARVAAAISGHAEAAVYDRYGNARLIRQPFSVEVGNQALAIARTQPARRYLPPQVAVTVTPSLGTSPAEPSAPGFRRVDVLRGALTTLRIHLVVNREGVLTIDDRPNGLGQSRLTGWRLDGAASDAPAATGTAPGTRHTRDDVLRLQWNTPDRIAPGESAGYVVPVTLYIETRFGDGHVASYAIPSSFSVSVNFAAESG